jgi:hypothetical protein
MVLITATTYTLAAEEAQVLQVREQTVFDELSRRFDARLDVLRQSATAQKVGGPFDARGRLRRRRKAGDTF